MFLGAVRWVVRPMDPSCYDTDGRVRYDRIANTDLFDDGIRDSDPRMPMNVELP